MQNYESEHQIQPNSIKQLLPFVNKKACLVRQALVINSCARPLQDQVERV